MEDPHTPQRLLEAFLGLISDAIVPLTARRIREGRGKVFGAAILRKRDLSLVLAESNIDNECPVSISTRPLRRDPGGYSQAMDGTHLQLWHGETHCIKRFYELPAEGPEGRPRAQDCFFLTTHEPCSLCLRYARLMHAPLAADPLVRSLARRRAAR